MNTRPRTNLALTAFAFAFFAHVLSASARTDSPGAVLFACPPCASNCDGEVYATAGQCPVCKMQLVDKRRVDSGDLRPRIVGILVFDGVQIIDYTGPYEVFGQAGFKVFTVSEDGKTVTTAMGMSVNPTYSFTNCPNPEVLVIPGGSVQWVENNSTVIDWVRKQSVRADHVQSVCNGAFILAKTGLLNGRSATTFYGLIDELQTRYPRIDVVSDRSFVDSGKIVTSAGLFSGIDASLHVISSIYGKGRAQQIALHMEYDWRPDSKFARAALADRHIRDVTSPAGYQWKLLSTEGDYDRWEIKLVLKADLPAESMLESIDNQLSSQLRWTKGDLRVTKGIVESHWTFIDEDGVDWKGTASLAHMGETSSTYLVTLYVVRADVSLR